MQLKSVVPSPIRNYRFLNEMPCGLCLNRAFESKCPLCHGTGHYPPYELDFAWLDLKLGVEVEGGIHQKSGHSTGTGIQRDIRKQQLAALLGWRIIPVSASDIDSGLAYWLLQQLGEVRC